MAEVSEKQLELMAEELNDLHKTKLYSQEEINKILSVRKEYERQIQGNAKNVKNFTSYINYEKTMLRDMKIRRAKCKMEERVTAVEHKIIKRIKVLYEAALEEFSENMALLTEYLKFAKKVGLNKGAANAVTNAIKNHSDNPEVWQVAAKWHAYDRKDLNTAMMTLVSGLAIHKDSQLLFKEMLQIEIFEYEKHSHPNENEAERVMCIKRMDKIVITILENIPDCRFYTELLELLEKHQATVNIQDEIIGRLLRDYCDNENVWHALAQRERKDYSYPTFPSTANLNMEPGSSATANIENMITEPCTSENLDEGNSTTEPGSSESTANNLNTEPGSSKPVASSTILKRTPKARLQACFAKYREGLAAIPPSRKKKLWYLYIDFLFKLQEDRHGVATILKMDTMKSALNEASEEGNLSEKHYVAWAEMMGGLEEALKIYEKGTSAIPFSVDMWRKRLTILVSKNNSEELTQVFKRGIMVLKEQGLPLWEIIIQYFSAGASDEEDDNYIDLIYKDGVKQVEPISSALKPRYIEWLGLVKGIEAAREAYISLAPQKPYCKDLHTVMLRLEAVEMNNIETWGFVHKLACEQFGNNDVEVWIKHIQFFIRYNRDIPDLEERIQEIHNQALQALPTELNNVFLADYKKLRDFEG